MKIISFDGDVTNKIRRDSNQDNLFDLFQKNVVKNRKIPTTPYIIPREFEMRLDKVSNYIYGSSEYVEELMVLNDIINPYSIKEGQIIYYCKENILPNLYTEDNLSEKKEIQRQKIINSAQPNRNKKKLDKDQNLPPNVKPSNLKQIKVSKDNRVQIINSFQ